MYTIPVTLAASMAALQGLQGMQIGNQINPLMPQGNPLNNQVASNMARQMAQVCNAKLLKIPSYVV